MICYTCKYHSGDNQNHIPPWSTCCQVLPSQPVSEPDIHYDYEGGGDAEDGGDGDDGDDGDGDDDGDDGDDEGEMTSNLGCGGGCQQQQVTIVCAGMCSNHPIRSRIASNK